MSGAHLGERLSVLLDGELSAAERAEAEAHLGSCAACARELAELAAVDALVREAPVPAPDGYFDALPGRVRNRIRHRRRVGPAVWAAGAAAAAVVLVSVVAPLTLRRAAPIGVPARPAHVDAQGAPTAAPAPAGTSTPEAVDLAPARTEAAASAGETRGKRAFQAPPPAPAAAREPAAAETDLAKERAAAPKRDALRDRLQAHAGSVEKATVAGSSADAAARRPSELKAEAAEAEEGYAVPPAAAAPQAAPAPAPAERKLGLAGGGAFAHPDRALMDDQRYRALAERRPSSAPEARALRDAWELFARDRPTEPRADEARVRAIECGILAWRLGGEAADLATARDRARAYLAVEGAPQGARVRAALDGLPAEPQP